MTLEVLVNFYYKRWTGESFHEIKKEEGVLKFLSVDHSTIGSGLAVTSSHGDWQAHIGQQLDMWNTSMTAVTKRINITHSITSANHLQHNTSPELIQGLEVVIE